MACNYIVCAIVSIMCIVLQRQRNLFYIRWPATLFTIFWHFIHKWLFSSKITIRGFDPTGVLGCSAAPLLCTFLVPSIYIWGVLLEKIREFEIGVAFKVGWKSPNQDILGHMARSLGGQKTRWADDQMSRWPDDQMYVWLQVWNDGKMTGWSDVRMTKCPYGQMTKYP